MQPAAKQIADQIDIEALITRKSHTFDFDYVFSSAQREGETFAAYGFRIAVTATIRSCIAPLAAEIVRRMRETAPPDVSAWLQEWLNAHGLSQ